jgi:transposase
MSREEESALLEQFRTDAEAGKVVETKAIKQAYAEKVGHETRSHGQIYKLLARHGWRKVMPRSRHPKSATQEAREASKKLTPR